MADQKKNNNIWRRIYDYATKPDSEQKPSQERDERQGLALGKTLAEVGRRIVHGIPGLTHKGDTDLSSTSEWSQANNAEVSTGSNTGAPSISSNSSQSNQNVGSGSYGYSGLDDQQKDIDKRREALRQSYAQGKYDLSTKEGRENYRRDTMFSGFGTWKGQKSPMALLRRADRELKRGNKAQAQHWLDMHDELYGDKDRKKMLAMDLEAIEEEQSRLDKRREEANKRMLAQSKDYLEGKKLEAQKEKEDYERAKDKREYDLRLAQFKQVVNQFERKLAYDQEQANLNRETEAAKQAAKEAQEKAAQEKAERERIKAAQRQASSNLGDAQSALRTAQAKLSRIQWEGGADHEAQAAVYNALEKLYRAEDDYSSATLDKDMLETLRSIDPKDPKYKEKVEEAQRKLQRAYEANKTERDKAREEERGKRRKF